MARLFVAVWPDDPTRAALAQLPGPEEIDVRRVPRANWHVTLRFVGEADPNQLLAALDGTELPAATARLGPVVETLGSHLVVPVSGVDELAGAVREATAGVGERNERPFRGHLTLARTKRSARSTLVGHPIAAEFTVIEVAVVASTLDPGGARYETIAVFPTGDR
jgi:2'-5' RNA ligase